ncbi:aquaporin AQPcic-like [Prorops nasuta]|uniref:aquaporin AQPcic-like n=1 Tax=Prorops nasuta TaxID=863751 RepID=UPI0034CF691F
MRDMSAYNLRQGWAKLVQGEGALQKTAAIGLAELLGTGSIVFLGCMGCVGSMGTTPSHLQISITFGLAVMIVIQNFAHLSEAHVNPAITVGSVVLGRKSIPEALFYICAQMIGAVAGYGMLKVLTPSGLLTSGRSNEGGFCATSLHSELSPIQGMLMEASATGLLMLLACALWDHRCHRSTESASIKFGLAVACLAMAVGPYTGCSMNPARSFAPALWNLFWSHHWVYWFGPLSGAIMTAFLYRAVFSSDPEVDVEYKNSDATTKAPESIALNSSVIVLEDLNKQEQI